MKTSVIIAAYKSAWCLPRCLKSIEAQIVKPDEILIGADGCRETYQAAVNFKVDIPKRVYFFDPNVGPYLVRNTLSCLARYDILALFDADDEMNPDYLETMLPMVEPGVFARPGYLNIDQKGNQHVNKWAAEGALCITKDDVLKQRGWEPWRCAADTEFRLRAERAGIKWREPDKPVMIRYKHGENLTRKEDTGMKSEYRAKCRELTAERAKENYQRTEMALANYSSPDVVGSDIEIIVPKPSDTWRGNVWKYCRRWWESEFPECHIREAEEIQGENGYSKSKSVNAAVRQSGARVIIVADADVIPDAEMMRDALKIIDDGEFQFAMPHKYVERLSRETTAEIVGGGGRVREGGGGALIERRHQGMPCGGVFCCRRQAFLEIGGFDEELSGWGGEDLDLFHRVPDIEILPGTLTHYWHEEQEDKHITKIRNNQHVMSKKEPPKAKKTYKTPKKRGKRVKARWINNKRVVIDEGEGG
jgi:glycosyltransferase involved in cell wall biosynthesis